ncbi:hypothetical protein CVS40_12675 [Lucilia cuprina]|nr:hypothetical protein CVS40_12675 [Lucilia cuprina]
MMQKPLHRQSLICVFLTKFSEKSRRYLNLLTVKIYRNSVSNFQELLNKAREVEQLVAENKQERVENGTPLENHKNTKIEGEKHKHKEPEIKLNCYGCGAAGFYRSNCPCCNTSNDSG